MQTPETFSLTLQSNRQTDIFSDNTNYSFRNTVPPYFNLKDYRVSLHSAYFTDTYKRASLEPRIVEPEVKTNFYDTYLAANRIIIQSATISALTPIKTSDKFDQFVISTNGFLETHKIPLHISPILDKGVVVGITLENLALAHEHIIIDEELAAVLGFSNLIVPQGESNSDSEFSLSHFDKFKKLDRVGLVERYIFVQRELELSQIVGRPKLSELLVDISTLCLANGHTFDLTPVHGRDDLIEFEVIPSDTRIILSNFLNTYLGLPKRYAFQGSGTVKITSGLEDFEEIDDYLEDHTKASCSKIFICTDIIDPNYHAGSPKSYLAVVNRRDTNSEEVEYFPEKSLYKSVNFEKPSHIEISFQSDDNSFLPFSKSPSVVILNFKRLGLL